MVHSIHTLLENRNEGKDMNLSNVCRIGLAAAAFPLTVWNLTMNKVYSVPPPGKMVKTKYSNVHVIDSGAGPATVIVEAGLSSVSLDWCFVQPEISKSARVISYDRGNYGWSRSERKTLTAQESVEELREVLTILEAKPPYILVGHSYGGMIMRLFASIFPDETAGLILEDAAHENQYTQNEQNKKRIRKFNSLARLGYITSLMGIPRMLAHKVGRRELGPDNKKALNYIGYTPGAFQSLYFEFRDTARSARQLVASKSLPSTLPVTVISARNPSHQWNQNQLLLAKLTQNTTMIKTDTGHSVHVEKPEIIIQAIREMIHRTGVRRRKTDYKE
jgi:pimeloyl-ACP methyl ester carboxylesterase